MEDKSWILETDEVRRVGHLMGIEKPNMVARK